MPAVDVDDRWHTEQTRQVGIARNTHSHTHRAESQGYKSHFLTVLYIWSHPLAGMSGNGGSNMQRFAFGLIRTIVSPPNSKVSCSRVGEDSSKPREKMACQTLLTGFGTRPPEKEILLIRGSASNPNISFTGSSQWPAWTVAASGPQQTLQRIHISTV